MKKYLLLALSLCACQARPDHSDIRLANGGNGYKLDCDITQFTFAQCDAEARRLCDHKDSVLWYYKENSRNTVVECLDLKK